MFTLPTSRCINEDVRQKFETAWGTPLSSQVGMTVTEMIPAAPEGKIKALYILGENPIMTDPDTKHIRHCLDQFDFMVLQEIFPSETATYADVLLPGVTFAEKTGTFTNTERRIQLCPPSNRARRQFEARLVNHHRNCETRNLGRAAARSMCPAPGSWLGILGAECDHG